jgi:uncharacterized protein (TIGR01777 family)
MLAKRLMMRVLVTGGTGFIGRKMVGALLARGYLVTVLTRDVLGVRGTLDPRARVAAWTPWTQGVWTEEVSGVDAVLHLAGAGVFDEPWSKDRIEVLRWSRVDTTHQLSRAIAAAKKRPRLLISASAIGIYGMHTDDAILDEQSAQGSDVLAEICRAWEKAAAPAVDSGVRVVHPRLGIVLGADGGALHKMLPAFKLRMGGPLGDGQQWVSWIHWRDVVDGIDHAIQTSAMQGPFNFTAPTPVRMSELAHAIGLVLDTHSRARVPKALLELVVGKELAAILLTGQRVSSKKLEDAGFAFSYPQLLPALEELIGPK